MIRKAAIDLPADQIAEFCRRWKITELALFGSVLRNDFGPDSDVDVLVNFSPDAFWSLLDETDMERELTEIIERPVDLVSRRAVQQSTNWIRRNAILASAEPLYVAG